MSYKTNNLRKLAALFVAAATMLGAFSATAYGAENPFSDLSETNPHYDAILELYSQGIISGMSETEFAPDIPLTRGMFVTLLGHIAEGEGLTVNDVTSTQFSDVDPQSWYINYVDWAYKKGVVSGTSDTTFHPDTSVTREQAAAILVRFAQITHLQLKTDGPTLASMTDSQSVSQWFTSDMETALAAGLAIVDEGSVLAPQTPATRGEAASLLYNLKTNYVDSMNVIELGHQYIPVIADLPVSTYDLSAFRTTAEGYKVYDDGTRSSIMGIDVSTFQGTIDWAKVKESGVEFAMVRVGGRGYGSEGNLYEDDQFAANLTGASEVGIKTGVYFFSQAVTVEEAREEAAFVLERIRDYSITYPVVFDWELIPGVGARTDNLDSTTLTNCAVAFCQDIQSAGYTPMIYANKSLALQHLDLSRLKEYPFWLAEYNDLPEYYYDFQIWQYSDIGKVNGINGSVDMNVTFVDYSAK